MDALSKWKRYQELDKYLKQQLGDKQLYEMKNIIERFVISERQANPDNYQSVVDKFHSEVAEKHLEKKLGNAVLDMLGVTTPRVNNSRISYGEITVDLSPNLFSAVKKFHNYNPLDIVNLYVEYNVAANNSNQWSIPTDVYKKALSILTSNTSSGTRVVEGCASLFNSNLLPLLAPEPCYCSLYPLEKKYGSLGTLDSALDLPENSDVFWIINPPFIESIMLSLGKQLLAKPDRKFFWIMPYWVDSPAYEIFHVMGDKIASRILRKNTYAYQSGDKRITARFDSVMFTTDRSLLDLM